MNRLAFGALVATVTIHGCSSEPGETFASASLDRALTTSVRVDGDALRQHVAAIVATRVAETPVRSPYNIQENHTRVGSAQYVAAQFRATGLSPVEETTTGDAPLTNVYVEIPGERPEWVLLTGHHDAWLQAGADDNGSAVAVLLEAARILKDAKPKRSIRIVAFDREEEGLLGSNFHAARHAKEQVRVVLNMDCVGYASRAAGSQDAPTGLALRDVGDFLAVLVNRPARGDLYRVSRLSTALAEPLLVLGLVAPSDGYTAGTGSFLRSDHAAYWKAGTPALFFTDTADFRNKAYHTADDTPEKLDYDFLRQAAQLIIGSVAAFAEGD